ncbi:MAG: hypothetical protein ACLSHP_11230 [Coprococcus sp.]
MEKNEVWENIKKYAKVFFQGVGLFLHMSFTTLRYLQSLSISI